MNPLYISTLPPLPFLLWETPPGLELILAQEGIAYETAARDNLMYGWLFFGERRLPGAGGQARRSGPPRRLRGAAGVVQERQAVPRLGRLSVQLSWRPL